MVPIPLTAPWVHQMVQQKVHQRVRFALMDGGRGLGGPSAPHVQFTHSDLLSSSCCRNNADLVPCSFYGAGGLRGVCFPSSLDRRALCCRLTKPLLL